MEFCSAGTLADLVAARAVSSAEVVVLQTQCCDAVAHLHSLQPSIIHRDIKLENFLLSASGGVKLCDFGSVTSKSVVPLELTFSQISAAEEDMNLNTTPQNRSPEMLDMHSGKVVGKAGDVWALGCGMFFLCFRTHPFEDAAKLAIINAKYRLPPAETSKHASLHHIITSLLNTNPDDRPSARGAVEMLQSAGIPGVNLVNPQAFVSHVSAAASAPTSPNPRTTAMSPDTTNEAGPTASESGGASTRARGLFGSLGSGAASMVSKARDRAGVAVRSAVSKVTRGLDETNKHGGTAGDLDLTYICPRVLVMATPADPADLAAYLQAEHPQQCLVFDLSDPKRQLDSARFPSIPIEHVKWQAGQSCSLKRLFMLCSAIHGWLLKSTTNVVAVHCPTGREDAGTVAAAYLAFSRLCSAQDAMRLFHMKRMAEGKRAITMSQQPYIGYIHKIVSGKPPHVRAIHIGSVVLETIPLFNTRGTGCKPYLEVYQSGKLVKRAPDPAASTLYTNESGVSATIDVGVDVVGDVLIIAFHEYTMLGHSTSTEMFSIQFHTGFVDDKGYLRPGFEIEAPRKKPAKFDRAFGVRVDCKIVNKQLKKEMPWQVRSSSLDLSFWTAPSMSCQRCYSSHSRVGRLCVCLCVRANM
jgi:cyclin G-associated kinase